MARRPRPTDDDISLFPFLSIIASVIGVLTMMIATLALAQTDTPDVAQIEKYEQTKKDLQRSDERIEELKREISVSKSAALELREQKKVLSVTIAELEQLLKELEQVEKDLAEQKQIKIVIPQLQKKDRETVTDMQSELEQLKEQLAQLEKELKDRTENSEANVTVLPQGSGLNYKPQFVECAEGSVVMHSLPTPKRIRTAEIVKDKDFIALLEQVANSTNDSIVFLLRSDGLGSYRACKKLCDERELRSGKIPIVGKGRIDLSVFIKANRR